MNVNPLSRNTLDLDPLIILDYQPSQLTDKERIKQLEDAHKKLEARLEDIFQRFLELLDRQGSNDLKKTLKFELPSTLENPQRNQLLDQIKRGFELKSVPISELKKSKTIVIGGNEFTGLNDIIKKNNKYCQHNFSLREEYKFEALSLLREIEFQCAKISRALLMKHAESKDIDLKLIESFCQNTFASKEKITLPELLEKLEERINQLDDELAKKCASNQEKKFNSSNDEVEGVEYEYNVENDGFVLVFKESVLESKSTSNDSTNDPDLEGYVVIDHSFLVTETEEPQSESEQVNELESESENTSTTIYTNQNLVDHLNENTEKVDLTNSQTPIGKGNVANLRRMFSGSK